MTELVKQFEQCVAGVAVNTDQGFIQKDEFSIRSKRTSNNRTLALTTRKLADIRVSNGFKSNQPDGVCHPFFSSLVKETEHVAGVHGP